MANISQIKLPNNVTYDIYDAKAFHSIEDIGLGTVMRFCGVTESLDTITSAKAGDVYIIPGGRDDENDKEYICTHDFDGAANPSAWEELGMVYDAASTTHKHNVQVSGSNKPSTVTGTITTTIPTVSKNSKYLKVTAAQNNDKHSTEGVLGEKTQFTVSGGGATTKGLYAQRSTGVAVGADGTAKAITALGTPTKATAITELNTTTIYNPTATDVTIPNITSVGSKTDGEAASWSASVSNGVLSFSWTANTPTSVTMPTLGDSISASLVSTSPVTVATGSKTTAQAITGFGTHTTADALTGVKVTTQPVITLGLGSTDEGVEVVTEVGTFAVTAGGNDIVGAITNVADPTITAVLESTNNGGVAIDNITIGSTTATATHNLTAAAQEWTQGTTTVSGPVDD